MACRTDEFTPKLQNAWLMDENGSMINVQQENDPSLERTKLRLDEIVHIPVKSDIGTHPLTSSDKRPPQLSRKGNLAMKNFKSRPSVLTGLLDISHFRAIYHILIALFVLFLIKMVITELNHPGTYDVVMQGFKFAFYANLHITLGILFGMHFVTILCVYPAFSFWSTYRQSLQTGSAIARLNYFALGAFLTYLVGFIFIPAILMWNYPLPPGSGFGVALEQVRLIMKVYAFVRSNAPRAIKFKTPALNFKKCEARDRAIQKSDSGDKFEAQAPSSELEQTSSCPEYAKYIYFLFAPTLIYMDSYPRTDRIRWTCLAWNIGQLLGCLMCFTYIVADNYVLYFSKIGHPDQPASFTQFGQQLLVLMPSAITLLILAFICVMHACQNAFAEILRFADRQFYKDWWNCSSFPSFLRAWNIIVYDWLYIYVLKDAVEIGLGRIHFTIPTILTLSISAITHEYIIFFGLSFFLPVLLPLCGGFGLCLACIKYPENSFGNFMLLMGLILGSGLLFGVYGYELSARWNCPVDEKSAWDFLMPRALSSSCGFSV